MKSKIILIVLFFFITGCSVGPRTITYDIASLTTDHTVGIASNPFSATGMLLSRVKIFVTETLARIRLKFINFPLLDTKIPVISEQREFLDKDKLNRWLDRKTGKPVKGNVSIFLSGQDFFPVLEEDILTARKYVNISTYIFDNDKYGKAFADILKKKSKTVPVKVISDMLACATAWEKSDDDQGLSNMESLNMFRYLTEDSKVKIRKSRNIWLISDHTKMIAIDGEKVFFGGMNIGNEYRYDWRDLMFEVQGDLTFEFQKIFNHAWSKYSFFGDILHFFKKQLHMSPKEIAGATDFHILRTTTYRQEIYTAQIQAARRAKHHIYVENPYIWNEIFLYELCAARKRGVDVRVTIPDNFDVRSFAGINKKVANILLKHGVRIFI